MTHESHGRGEPASGNFHRSGTLVIELSVTVGRSLVHCGEKPCRLIVCVPTDIWRSWGSR